MAKRLRVLVAGCGRMGSSHAHAYRSIDDFEVVGLVDRDSKRTAALAERTRHDYSGALSLLRHGVDGWQPRAFVASAIESRGIAEVWAAILEHRALLEASGQLLSRRHEQSRAWMWKRAFGKAPRLPA